MLAIKLSVVKVLGSLSQISSIKYLSRMHFPLFLQNFTSYDILPNSLTELKFKKYENDSKMESKEMSSLFTFCICFVVDIVNL